MCYSVEGEVDYDVSRSDDEDTGFRGDDIVENEAAVDFSTLVIHELRFFPFCHYSCPPCAPD